MDEVEGSIRGAFRGSPNVRKEDARGIIERQSLKT